MKKFCLKEFHNLDLMWPVEAKWGLEGLRGWADAGKSPRAPSDVQDQWGARGRAGRRGFLMLDSVMMTAPEPESIFLIKADALKEHDTQKL